MTKLEAIIRDLIDVCYPDGSSSGWKLCIGCNIEYMPVWGSVPHSPDCPVKRAEDFFLEKEKP